MESHAIHGVLSQARSLDLDQRELLHPAPTRVHERGAEAGDIHLRKTPVSPT